MNTSTSLIICMTIAAVAFGQAPLPLTVTDETQASTPKSLPQYAVYRHFLAWVKELDKAASESGSSDPYKFAEAITRSNLQHEHLDILRDAAHRLHADLQQHEARAQIVITRYRTEARAALAQGKALPPAPPEIRDLERQHTALLIHHYVTLRAALGPDVSAQLDAYLRYEFTPHIKLRRMAAPTAPTLTQPSN